MKCAFETWFQNVSFPKFVKQNICGGDMKHNCSACEIVSLDVESILVIKYFKNNFKNKIILKINV